MHCGADHDARSLHATFLRNRIIGALRGSPDTTVQAAAANISQNFVFEHSTIQDLASAIADIAVTSSIAAEEDPVPAITSLIDQYSSNLPRVVAKTNSGDDIVVLCTGTTGNVGSYILAALLSDNRIKRVYALNRLTPTSTINRQNVAFEERDLPVELLASPKLVGLYGDITLGNFGLKKSVYDEVRAFCISRALRS